MAQKTSAADMIEPFLDEALAKCERVDAPPGLASAMHYAVKPGGARIRPKLCLAVAQACGCDALELALSAGAALELMHCASLVHDDLPAFDNAPQRRGKPSVHIAYGEPLALLAGDALIVLAFEILADHGEKAPNRLVRMTRRLAQCIGMPSGICAGQAWECEPNPDLQAYHEAKTGSLFAGAALLGAEAAGYKNADDWRAFGLGLGRAYQVADDIRDVVSNPKEMGKPAGQDKALGRPNAAATYGTARAVQMLAKQVDETLATVPDCPGRKQFIGQVKAQSQGFLPARVWALAA